MPKVKKFVNDYSISEQGRFRELFAFTVKRSQRKAHRRFVVSFFFVIVLVIILYVYYFHRHYYPNPHSPESLFWWFNGVLLLWLLNSEEFELKCPACRNIVNSNQLGCYCPACGRNEFKSPVCDGCGKRIFWYKGSRCYKICACTHCGIFLNDKGI